jgi:hypothetical protein|tara:strand:+ start:376 stop:540 length:165 start_codon:yes stop_codon:yes gene_type:complete
MDTDSEVQLEVNHVTELVDADPEVKLYCLWALKGISALSCAENFLKTEPIFNEY